MKKNSQTPLLQCIVKLLNHTEQSFAFQFQTTQRFFAHTVHFQDGEEGQSSIEAHFFNSSNLISIISFSRHSN